MDELILSSAFWMKSQYSQRWEKFHFTSFILFVFCCEHNKFIDGHGGNMMEMDRLFSISYFMYVCLIMFHNFVTFSYLCDSYTTLWQFNVRQFHNYGKFHNFMTVSQLCDSFTTLWQFHNFIPFHNFVAVSQLCDSFTTLCHFTIFWQFHNFRQFHIFVLLLYAVSQ